MSQVIKSVLDNSIYFGKLVIEQDADGDRFKFNTPYKTNRGINKKQFTEFGDVVYFMFVDNVLQKIGKAAGAHGFWDRQAEYCKKAKYHDKTTTMIMRTLKELGQTEIEVFAVFTPKQRVESTCELTGEATVDYIEMASARESRFTTMYLKEDHGRDLLMCTQK